ncbi:ABC transporter permease [Scatolibacter rhodanostii]|uniref:ABC transporter permease n=1 Tax=Scatolibacter rhodanostii TaxID=2014781 RepID=UPI000C06FE2F|nr:ABC transporter permease subunit [Scatolibacter rhodanostii]
MNRSEAVKTKQNLPKKDLPKKKTNVFQELWRNKFLYILAVPAMVYVFVYSYASLPYVAIAFEKFNYKTGILSPFVGFDNFKYFFQSSWAWLVTRNTLVINVVFLIFGTIFAVLLAIILNEIKKKKFLKITQSTMLFPYFISWVIVSYMLQGLLGTENGLINNLIANFGGDKTNFYSTPSYWYPILLILHIWKNTGYTAIIYLAAITGIDEGLYEAAYIDGATRMKRIRYITLPLLMPTICIMTLMSIGKIFYGDFGMFYAIIRDNSSLMPIAEVIDTYVYRTFKNTGDPGLSMAIGLYQSVVGFILVFTSNRVVKKFFPEGALF